MLNFTSGHIISFDYGKKNIGIAIGQQITNTAQPLITLRSKNEMINFKKIKSIIYEWNPKIIVIGLPLNMDGTFQPITKKVNKFARKIKKHFSKIKLFLHDERLSSIEARLRLFKHKKYKIVKKIAIDSESAVIILESWLQQYIHNIKKN